jgi:hypothetical protein
MAASMPKPKQVRIAETPRTEKVPKYLQGSPLHDGRHVSWRFSHIDRDGPWPCGALSSDELLARLTEFEQMNTASLGDRRHAPSIERLCKDARDRLRDIQRDDLDRLFSWRVGGTGRIWCAEYGGIMCVLWWDPDHTVLPTPKRHT